MAARSPEAASLRMSLWLTTKPRPSRLVTLSPSWPQVAAYIRGGQPQPAVPASAAAPTEKGAATAEPAEATGHQRPPAQQQELHPPAEVMALLGEPVELQGLTGRPELNGRRGTAREWVGASQRVGVDVEGVGRLALRLDNLRFGAALEGTEAPGKS